MRRGGCLHEWAGMYISAVTAAVNTLSESLESLYDELGQSTGYFGVLQLAADRIVELEARCERLCLVVNALWELHRSISDHAKDNSACSECRLASSALMDEFDAPVVCTCDAPVGMPHMDTCKSKYVK
jgi:hypothetical protein